jgi:hypothetical protein
MTVGTGINRALVVYASRSSSSGAFTFPVDSVTYAGVSLILVKKKVMVGAENNYLEAWALPAGTMPATGANNVVINFSGMFNSGNPSVNGMAMSFTGVDQATLYTDTSTASQINTTPNVTVNASSAQDMPISGVCARSALTGTTETSRLTVDSGGGGYCRYAGMATAAGGDTALSWTQTSNMIAVTVAVVLKGYVKILHKVISD